jgi:OmcA/MtrC family decaheme c-type cytochrome
MSKKIYHGMWIGLVLLLMGVVVMAANASQGTASPAAAKSTISIAAAAAPAVVTAPTVDVESCVICHPDAGAKHQASYDELFQDGVIQVTDLKYAFAAPDKSTVTFKMTKNGAPFNAAQADSLAIYFAPYTGGKFQFDPPADRLSLKASKPTYGADGSVTSVVTGTTDFSKVDGLVVVYGRDETVGSLPARVSLNKYPFAALLETGKGVDYVSPANNAGCEKCHTTPYLKHGYIYGEVGGDPATDFYTCKACHLDNGTGGHFEWQLLVDNPMAAAEFLAQGEEGKLTPEQEAQYAYNTSVMNDVHMSHAMEFPYPQSMSSCVTCHEGKLDMILTDANFKISTCKSCHPMTGAKAAAKEGEDPAWDTTGLALKTIVPEAIHGSMDLEKTDCTTCHGEGKAAASFKQIHSGYDKMIYTADGLRYSDAISVTIDSASFAKDVLTFKFSGHQGKGVDDLDVATITPTVLIGLYGWDTKDYVIGPHERLIDDNKDGAIDSKDSRNLEAEAGEKHPRITTVSAEGGKWEFTADLSAWSDMIVTGTVKRVEIAVIPTLVDANGVTLALDAPSRTFDLGANKFADDSYSPIVKVEGCETCHDALATNYHTPDRGGNVVVCRLCHITKSGGSHLEMQSRSIDSYAHSIHSGQAFDVGSIDFTDPVQALHYDEHIEFPYPMHGITNCESCHEADAYNVPDQSMSLPGLLSKSSELSGRDRKIGTVPSFVTGPASRACGGCHRAAMINEDAASELLSFNQHTKQGGYLIDATKGANDILMSVFDQIMANFK